MQSVKNLTNSPYDIRLKGGQRIRLHARGEIGPVELDPFHLPLYRALGYFVITEDEKKAPTKEPKKGEGKQPDPDKEEIKALRKEYEAKFGKKAFNGWDAEQLKAKLAEE